MPFNYCKANKCPTQSCCWCKPDIPVSWNSISNKSCRAYSVTVLISKRVLKRQHAATSVADPWSDEVDGKAKDTTWQCLVVSDTVRGPERRLRYERRGTRTGCAVILTAPTPALTPKRIGSSLCYSLTGDNKAGYSNSKSVSVTFFPFKRLQFSQEWHQSESQNSCDQHDKQQCWVSGGKLLNNSQDVCDLWRLSCEGDTDSAVVAPVSAGDNDDTADLEVFPPLKYWGHSNSRTPSWTRNVHGPTDEHTKGRRDLENKGEAAMQKCVWEPNLFI